MADSAKTPLVVPRRSFFRVVWDHPYIVTGFTVLGAAIAAVLFLKVLSGDEEAPIRVKNGSLDFLVLDPDQRWERIGTSDNWQIKDRTRYRNDFDVTVAPNAGATCTGPLNVVGGTLRLTYNDNGFSVVIVMQSPSRKTLILPQAMPQTIKLKADPGGDKPTLLTYRNPDEQPNDRTRYVSRIEVGANLGQLQEICSFASRDQLNSILILNTK